MSSASTLSLIDDLRQHHLLDAAQLDELKSLPVQGPDPKALAKELIQRGWLTPYQANQILQGRAKELLLGSYVLRARVGEGGMGQVFQARNWKLGRIVAVKLIRKERLNNADAIRRFQREVRAVAALGHPNIVLAYDADEIGGTHFLVMEYIDGAIDLAGLVKKNGPLPVAQACEYIRQAALGLQHASERGLVHRDIKPQNLLLAAGSVVKILDMGLARLDEPAIDDDKSSTMTREGTIMGTIDYISPEQAQESHTVDIRSDIYSLGCTFYFLLAGRVPFPGGTLLNKIDKHRFAEPEAVEKLRPNAPAMVTAIVRKMMAKKREERYQTPAELATVLATTLRGLSGVPVAAAATDRTVADGPLPVALPVSQDTLASPFAALATSPGDVVDAPTFLHRGGAHRQWWLLGGAASSLVLVGLAILVFVLVKMLGHWNRPVPDQKPEQAVVSEESTKRPPKTVDEDIWLKEVAGLPADKQVKAVVAPLKELNKGFDGKVTFKIDDKGMVTEFQLLTVHVTTISPLRAFTQLQALDCNGTQQEVGKLVDLSPLKGMPLTSLVCNYTKVSDLSPLKDMKLTRLDCGGTPVSNLTPLKDMKLTRLNCGGTQVSNLTPLKDMKLTILYCGVTRVSDLSPLKDMQLTFLNCESTPVSDLTPLKDMKLTNLGIYGTPVSDLTPLKDMKLTNLSCDNTKVSDLSPLKDMKLTSLNCGQTGVSDLTPLKNMKLTDFYCGRTPVSDLTPLKDMKLTSLDCARTKVTDLSPLQGMPLTELYCDFQAERDAALLRSFKTLERINGKPAADFWKEVDEKNPNKNKNPD